MIYITGDKHGIYNDVVSFCDSNNTSTDDILIILGDAGINYFLDERDIVLKKKLSNLPITLFCIHGNHEERAFNIKSYVNKYFCNGIVYYEKEYPNILFAVDGEVYSFDNKKTLVIGGAYSVDKEYRLSRGYSWFSSEQPDNVIKNKIRNLLKSDNNIDVVLSHTCPYKYMPKEAFLEGINQNSVDNTTEEFLEEIEGIMCYKKWYCGHYHIDKEINKIKFMFNEIKNFE